MKDIMKWAKEVLSEAMEEGYEIRIAKNEKAVEIKDGEVAIADEGIIAIIGGKEKCFLAKKREN